MDKLQEVKIVFIGESGCGKSTLIRHLAESPQKLKYASSSDGHAGTTKVTIEYLFGDYEFIRVNSVFCNIKYSKDSDLDFFGDTGFETFLSNIEDVQKLEKSNDNYVQTINNYAKQYLNGKSLQEVFKIINTPNTFFNQITMEVPANKDLYSQMRINEIDVLRIVDTRGLGDQDDIERVIPFAGADAIIIVGKNETPSPVILQGLIKVCQDYKHLPVLFIGKHAINEDEVNITSVDTADDYLSRLIKFNKNPDCSIRRLYADVCEEHLELIKPVQDVMKECRINNVPYINSLAFSTAKESNYYKFYVPACIQIFSNCIKTISSYQIAQKDVSNQLRNSKANLFNSMFTKEILESVIHFLSIEPKKYNRYVDFLSVAKGYSERHGSPLDYSYDCVAATMHAMLKTAIDRAIISVDNTISNDILLFFFNRVLQHNSYNWYWGYDNGYYYTIINFSYKAARECKKKLREQNLKLDQVVCKRFGKQYDRYDSIKILLFEESLNMLINKIDSDIDVNNYFSNILDADPA
ncbi:GTPase SAR1 family protein [Paenibacillus jamilae]|jgi:GTPase SAR1 family protein|uniref:hypothetical protein n=1 Tax=Paenibacillus TaxID=44249 RepID=UPI000D31B14E|nr:MULTISPECIES: hypothetical protein [Paenibacillus]MDP9678574.1 GTPase SAR1 family protein [Paenibacillus jamilae]KAF6615941.1 hypothetical protein HFE00_17625 [Paenibacillus sp. EKM101P]KAF6620917.1 hypothetical protein HFE03_16025 [Paenibacillus sp. EKM102P]KAF6629642.1 hypothetical protein HFE01_16480 [Paenibacillus sp. EKM10P]KAF6645422.1 hypothetical protein HFE02_18170 [Paenibacillus sp. EKM11P]